MSNLLAFPITKEIDYRSNIISNDLNIVFRSLEESVLRALMKGAELTEQLQTINFAINSAYKGLNLNNQIYNSYPKAQDIPSGEYGGVAYATAFGSTYCDGSKQNTLAGIVTMDWNNKFSKIPIYNSVVSPAVQIYLDGTLRSVGDAIYNILDNDPSTFWVESATTGSHTIEIDLPPSSQKTFNYIEVNPFPLFGVQISGIEYYDDHSISHIIYPTKDNPFYLNSGPLVFHMAPRIYNNTIKITLNVLEGINAIGLTSVDICSIDYLNNTSTTYFEFENIPTSNHKDGSEMTSIIPKYIDLDFFIDGIIDDNYDSFIQDISLIVGDFSGGVMNEVSSFQIPTRKRGRNNISSSNTITLNDTLYLKIKMEEVNLTTPMFRGAKLNYRDGT